MFDRVQELWRRGYLIGVGGAIAIAFAVFYLVSSIVRNLIAPAVSVFIGDPLFERNAFVVNTSEFRYGYVIEAGLTLLLTVAFVYLAARLWRTSQAVTRTETRCCPECTWEIPALAKRCPYCTSQLQSAD